MMDWTDRRMNFREGAATPELERPSRVCPLPKAALNPAVAEFRFIDPQIGEIRFEWC